MAPASTDVAPPGRSLTAIQVVRVPDPGDPRLPLAAILTFYAVLGCTVLGFNRDPWQIVLTVAAGLALEIALHWVLKRQLIFPLSAYISCVSLALLLNYSHNYFLLFLPVFLTIASKYLLTFQGRHVFNPSLFAVAVCLKLGGGLFSSAPAYQWAGSLALVVFMITAGLALFVFRVKRFPLVSSFLLFYAASVLLRAYVSRYHLPPQTLILGNATSASLYLFTFFMITDPATSPESPRAQVWWAFAIVAIDLYLHTQQSLSTLFYALFLVSAGRWAWFHGSAWRAQGPWYPVRALLDRRVLAASGLCSAIAVCGLGVYRRFLRPIVSVEPGFSFEKLPPSLTGVDARLGTALQDVDARVQHFAKWLLAVGDAVAVGDFDNDGRLDLFITNPLMRPQDRCALYRNLGGFRFQRVRVPALEEITRHPEKYGFVSGALFVDYDNSGAQSLFLPVAYGKSRLLKNRVMETGKPEFVDVTERAGIDEQTISVAATFFDYDRDGKLDLLIANAINPYLADYPAPTPLNLYRLPQPEYPGDRRMLHFMHDGWHNANNGGLNVLLRNAGGGRFVKQDAAAMGMPETHWTLAAGTGDLNGDGYTDLYLASDFGPDDLYMNDHGRRFVRVRGPTFGSIGNDTYKGMNVSIGDLDNSGQFSVYVSNVHVPLQAEGSLLWTARPDPEDPFIPRFSDEATLRGALNEGGFGWGAAMGDLNRDGWLDIVQANGLANDAPDKRFDAPRDYWYQAAQIMRSGPQTHRYVDRWPDLRGYEIFGHQANRVYLSRGARRRAQFVDVAGQVGLTERGVSRGMALADLDNRGVLDLVVTHQFSPATIYRNTLEERERASGRRTHWLGLSVRGDGRRVSREAVGTQVRLRYPGEGGKVVTQLREVQIANGFSAQGDRRLLFGLGDYHGPVEVEISWYGGGKQVVRGLALDRYHALAYRGPAR